MGNLAGDGDGRDAGAGRRLLAVRRKVLLLMGVAISTGRMMMLLLMLEASSRGDHGEREREGASLNRFLTSLAPRLMLKIV